MNPLVSIFFIHTTLATFLLGFKFIRRRDPVFKYFGIGLILNALAFATWSAVVLLQLEDLNPYVTIGAVFFLISLIAYLISGIQKMDASARKLVIWAGSFIVLALLFLRIFIYPSKPGFSSEGLFFFSPHPIIQALEIFGLALVGLPAINALAAKFVQPTYSALVQYGFIMQVMGGIILITSINITLLYIAGWIIGIVYFLLWTTLLFSKKAWSNTS